jgi:hypothetical protein
MRSARRVAAPGIVLFVIVCFIWTFALRVHRPVSLEDPVKSNGENSDEWPNAEDKIVVMAKMETENTDWVMEDLPEYFPTYHLTSHTRLRVFKLATCYISHGEP